MDNHELQEALNRAEADKAEAQKLMLAAHAYSAFAMTALSCLGVVVFAFLAKLTPWYVQAPGYVMLILMLLAGYGEGWTLRYVARGNLLRAQQHEYEVNNAPGVAS